MAPEETPRETLESARIAALRPAPIAPYWEGRTFEECLNIPLHRTYNRQQWDEIFSTFTKLLASDEPRTRSQAVERLADALKEENRQRSRNSDSSSSAIEERLPAILDAIATQETVTPGIFEDCCKSFLHKAEINFSYLLDEAPLYRNLILQWLDDLEKRDCRQHPTNEAIQAARILYDGCGTSWQAARTELLTALDASDLSIRACAAYKIGKFCSQAWLAAQHDRLSTAELPLMEEMMPLIRDKEVERPGIAGAFLWGAPAPRKSSLVGEWILDILEHSPSPEPYLEYFPCNLAFDAHERFSRDATAIRRLMQMGRVNIAIAAATEESERIAEIEPLLVEMGNSKEPETVRLASWHLAYYYHYLHPQGAQQGYVEQIANLPEVDLFLLFSPRAENDSPYAAIIYAQGKDEKLSDAIARKWVDRIFPESARGKPLPELGDRWHQRGSIAYRGRQDNPEQPQWDNVIIGYRSDRPWNPKQFLK